MLTKLFTLIFVTITCILSPLTSATTITTAIEFNAKEAFSLHGSVLRTLMLDLYECQPEALQKSTKVSKEEFVQWVFEGPFGWKFDAIRSVQSIEALKLSVNQDNQGDRVLPFITGLYTMILGAYSGKNEYTFSDNIKPQKLILAVQNVEISAVKLLNLKHENGDLFIKKSCNSEVKLKLNEIIKNLLKDYYSLTKETTLDNGLVAPSAESTKEEFITL